MSETRALWDRIYAAFEGHRNPPTDPDPQAALNRIAAKCLRISFDPSNCAVHEEVLSVEALRLLRKFHDKADPAREGEPIVVLSFEGQRYVVDGHRRVNKSLASPSPKPLPAIIIEPINSA